ncbi:MULTISPECIES: Ig-like domain-containing protein [unclassified Blastococcus]
MAASAVALLAPALVGTAPASATPTGPGVGLNKNITVFHNLDFVGVFGYGSPGSTIRVEVIRAGVVIGVAQGPAWSTPEGVGLEVNHGLETGTPLPGDCWAGGVPDIRPGDRVVVTAGTLRNEVTVDDIRFTGPPEADPVTSDVLVHGIAKRADGTVIPPSALDSGEFRNESGKYRATPDVIEATPGVDGGFTMRYRAPYTGFRNSDGLTEAQRRQALLTEDGHAAGFGHVEPLPRETMLVDGIADVTGPAPGCENFQQDLLPPRVATQTPAPDTRDVGRATNVTLGLTETVTGLSAQTFTLTASDGQAVPAQVSYNRTTGAATLNPFPGTTETLRSGTRYTATVDGAVTDAAGNALQRTSWSFTTAGEGPDNDRTAPTVTSRTPGAAATGVGTAANVLIGFSEAMARPGADAVYLQTADGVRVPAAVAYNATTNTVIVNPTDSLAAGTGYDVVLTAGVTDVAGNPVQAETWRFTTAGAPAPTGDTVAPTVVSRSPASGATAVGTTANVLIGFSEAMARPSAEAVYVQTTAGVRVPAAVSWNATTNTVIVNPTDSLAEGTAYQVVLTAGVTDVAGNPVQAETWQFATRSAAPTGDTVAPTVVSRSPASGATAVGTTANVLIGFSEAMARPSAEAVYVQTTAGVRVPAAVSWNATTNTVIVNPTDSLAGGTAYQVVLTAGVTDVAGNPVQAETWQFTTRSA